MIAQYTPVRITTDRYAEEGVPEGTVGYVIEVYEGGYCEVEFSDPETGISFAQLVVAPAELVEASESTSRFE
jgi:hypothetical protein